MPTPTPGPPDDPQSEWYATRLEDILPRRGFTYPDGHRIFKAKQDCVLVKWAIEAAATPDLEEVEVDIALASIMSYADDIMKHYYGSIRAFTKLDDETRNTAFNAVIEAACQELEWTVIVPEGRFPHLMKKLFRARALYNELSHVRGLPEEDKHKKEGKLAKAIDKWIGTRPVKEPDQRYACMHQHLIDHIVDEKINGEEADWGFPMDNDPDHDSDNDDEDDNRRWIPWRELWYRKGAKSQSEDAPWQHNYFWSETSDDDGCMTNALLLKYHN